MENDANTDENHANTRTFYVNTESGGAINISKYIKFDGFDFKDAMAKAEGQLMDNDQWKVPEGYEAEAHYTYDVGEGSTYDLTIRRADEDEEIVAFVTTGDLSTFKTATIDAVRIAWMDYHLRFGDSAEDSGDDEEEAEDEAEDYTKPDYYYYDPEYYLCSCRNSDICCYYCLWMGSTWR